MRGERGNGQRDERGSLGGMNGDFGWIFGLGWRR